MRFRFRPKAALVQQISDAEAIVAAPPEVLFCRWCGKGVVHRVYSRTDGYDPYTGHPHEVRRSFRACPSWSPASLYHWIGVGEATLRELASFREVTSKPVELATTGAAANATGATGPEPGSPWEAALAKAKDD